MISDGISKRILTRFRRTDKNIWNWSFVIGQTVIPVFCNSNYFRCLGIFEIIYFPGIIAVLGIRSRIICTT